MTLAGPVGGITVKGDEAREFCRVDGGERWTGVLKASEGAESSVLVFGLRWSRANGDDARFRAACAAFLCI